MCATIGGGWEGEISHYEDQHYLTLIDCGPSRFSIWRPLQHQNAASIIRHLESIEHQWIALTFKPIVTWLAPWKASQLKLTSFIKERMSSMCTACGLAHFTRMDLSNSFAWVVSIHPFYPQQNYWGGSFLEYTLLSWPIFYRVGV